MTINEVKKVVDEVNFNEYNAISKNCQDYVGRILYELKDNLKTVGIDAIAAGGGIGYVKGGDLVC